MSIFKMKSKPNESVISIALAGAPNVGKSTLFNRLTGMNQHTGNWTGKTVSCAKGFFNYKSKKYELIDLPGTYSIMSRSAEEEIARDFICFGNSALIVVVCDATSLEHNLNLLLQIMQMNSRVLLCINLIDEAKKKGIFIDCELLSSILNIPVIPISARQNKGISRLLQEIDKSISINKNPLKIKYHSDIEDALGKLTPKIEEKIGKSNISPRWISIKLIEADNEFIKKIEQSVGFDFKADEEICEILEDIKSDFEEKEISKNKFREMLISGIVFKSQEISEKVTEFRKGNTFKERKIDKILTGKYTAFPIMMLLLIFIFWLSIEGANYPSRLLSDLFFKLEGALYEFLGKIDTPAFLKDLLILGVFRVLSFVVSVMLPPMALFFPLFTLLEDSGYLPRIAFNMDKSFQRCSACGKQSLTMCMGFGCNAVGVTGSRIIDSKRERLMAIITNSFVPCNGRFPLLIAISSMFFIAGFGGVYKSVLSALITAFVVLIGIGATFLASKLLSVTLLKGVPSSFILELPPYRKPQFFKVIVRSLFDRTLFVLGRAITSAIPAGLIIWIMANVNIDGRAILSYCTDFLNPIAKIFGLDGVILMAFILGFPANEIVMPIIIMSYSASGSISEFENLAELKNLLVMNGWTPITAICTMIFSLMHWPCATTVLSIKKETNSFKWSLISILLPLVFGLSLCFVINLIGSLF